MKVTANSKPRPKNVINVQHVIKIYQALPLLRFSRHYYCVRGGVPGSRLVVGADHCRPVWAHPSIYKYHQGMLCDPLGPLLLYSHSLKYIIFTFTRINILFCVLINPLSVKVFICSSKPAAFRADNILSVVAPLPSLLLHWMNI